MQTGISLLNQRRPKVLIMRNTTEMTRIYFNFIDVFFLVGMSGISVLFVVLALTICAYSQCLWCQGMSCNIKMLMSLLLGTTEARPTLTARTTGQPWPEYWHSTGRNSQTVWWLSRELWKVVTVQPWGLKRTEETLKINYIYRWELRFLFKYVTVCYGHYRDKNKHVNSGRHQYK